MAEIEEERLLYIVRMRDKRLSYDCGSKGMVRVRVMAEIEGFVWREESVTKGYRATWEQRYGDELENNDRI